MVVYKEFNKSSSILLIVHKVANNFINQLEYNHVELTVQFFKPDIYCPYFLLKLSKYCLSLFFSKRRSWVWSLTIVSGSYHTLFKFTQIKIYQHSQQLFSGSVNLKMTIYIHGDLLNIDIGLRLLFIEAMLCPSRQIRK